MTETVASAWPVLWAALLMGLLGSPHCVAMCGGIATALAPPIGSPDGAPRAPGITIVLALAAGRIGTYALLGALAGALGQGVTTFAGAAAGPALRLALGVLLVLVGASVAGWWPRALAWLEAVAGAVWSRLAPVTGRVLPVETPTRGILAGAVWGFLPCGLVYGALAGAAVAGSAGAGAGWMAVFGLGTLPAVVGAGWVAGRVRGWAGRAPVRHVAGALLVVGGLWTGLAPIWMHSGAHDGGAPHPASPHHHAASVEPAR